MFLTEHQPGSTQHTLATSLVGLVPGSARPINPGIRWSKKRENITRHYLINFLFHFNEETVKHGNNGNFNKEIFFFSFSQLSEYQGP